MSMGRSIGLVKGGCKNGRGGVDGEGERGNGEGEGDEIRGIHDDLFQEQSYILHRPVVNVNEVGEDGEKRYDDHMDAHVDVVEARKNHVEEKRDVSIVGTQEGEFYIRDIGEMSPGMHPCARGEVLRRYFVQLKRIQSQEINGFHPQNLKNFCRASLPVHSSSVKASRTDRLKPRSCI